MFVRLVDMEKLFLLWLLRRNILVFCYNNFYLFGGIDILSIILRLILRGGIFIYRII